MSKVRKQPSPLARVLASSNDGNEILSRFFTLLSPSVIRNSVRQLSKHRHFRPAINLSNPSPSVFYKQRTPNASFEKDVAWCLGIVELYRTDIAKAVDTERWIVRSLLKRDWDEVDTALDELEMETGTSMWLLALRGASLTAQGKSEEKRLLLTKFNEISNDNRYFKSVLYLKMNRLDEADILSGQSKSFEQKIKRTFSGETLHFVMYKIVQHSFDFDLDFSHVLNIEKNSCPIDIFNVLQDFSLYSRFSAIEHEYPELAKSVAISLSRIAHSSATRSLAAAYGEIDEFELPTDAYDILDFYTRGEYGEVCDRMHQKTDLSENFVLFETWVKSASRTRVFPDGYLGELVKASVSILIKDENFGASNAFLLAQCESFGGLGWFRELHFFVIRETLFLSASHNESLRWISWAISGIDTPLKLLVLPDLARKKYLAALAPLSGDHVVIEFIQKVLNDPKNIKAFPQQVERERAAKYLAVHFVKTGEIKKAIRLLRVIAKSADPIFSQEATRMLVGLLIVSNHDQEAVDRYVDTAIANSALQRAFDAAALAEACERLVRTSDSISISIALSLYSRFSGENYDATLRYAFEVFLQRNGCIRPEQIVRLDIPNYLINYFLEFVAVPSVMKLYPEFDSLADIEKCRISVCRLLIERGHRIEEMIDEVKYRNRQLVIAAGTRLVESSRIYADTGCFTHGMTSSPHRQLFDRFTALIKKTEFTESPDDQELAGVMRKFETEPILISYMHTVHIQNLVLNEKNATFLQLAKLMRDEFTFGVRGLAGYLSTRIRHGHLPNTLRRAVSNEGLLFSRILATGGYRDDSSWYQGIVEVQSNKKNDIHKAFNEFSSKFDAKIDEVNDEWLQIFAVDQDISGLYTKNPREKNLFNYSVTALESYYLQQQLDAASDYSDFVKLITGWLWSRTEQNLVGIREKLKSEVRDNLVSSLDQLSVSVHQVIGTRSDLSSQTKFIVNAVPKPFIRDSTSLSNSLPFSPAKRRQKYLACFHRISMRFSSGL